MALDRHPTILSESMHTGLTRFGFGCGRVDQEKSKPGDFPTTPERGLWLPQVEVSRRSLAAALGELGAFSIKHAGDQEVAPIDEAIAALEKVTLNDETGCWIQSGRLSQRRSLRVLWTIGNHEMRRLLNPETSEEMSRLQICETTGCLNTRHFDFTHWLESRTHLVDIEPSWYTVLPNGDIETIWHDQLLTIAASERHYRQLQQLSRPYTSSKRALFTADGMSKIGFSKISGCFPVRSYYTRPDGTDSYGRLRRRNRTDERNRTQGPAHREVWFALGYTLNGRPELNHLCGHRPCANTQHLDPDTREGNQEHGRRMQKAKRGTLPLF